MTGVLDVLTQGREAAEARMSDRCAITDAAGAVVWNATTEAYDAPETAIYSGQCRVKLSTSALEPDAGDTAHVVVRPTVHLPAAAMGIRIGQVVTITSAAHNASLVGARFRVLSLARESQATAQRLECTEVQA